MEQVNAREPKPQLSELVEEISLLQSQVTLSVHKMAAKLRQKETESFALQQVMNAQTKVINLYKEKFGEIDLKGNLVEDKEIK